MTRRLGGSKQYALSPDTVPILIIVRELRRQSDDTYKRLPDHLLYKIDDENNTRKTAFLFTLQLALYQESLLNRFLLDRLPGDGSFETKRSLIDTARKMLDAILVLAASRDKLANFYHRIRLGCELFTNAKQRPEMLTGVARSLIIGFQRLHSSVWSC